MPTTDAIPPYCLQVAEDRPRGAVLEYVKTSVGGRIVEEMCLKRGLQVDCVLLLEVPDLVSLCARMLVRHAGTGRDRPEDRDVHTILQRVRRALLWEQGLCDYYRDGHVPFHRIDTAQPVPAVASDLQQVLDPLCGPAQPTAPPSVPAVPLPVREVAGALVPEQFRAVLQLVRDTGDLRLALLRLAEYTGVSRVGGCVVVCIRGGRR